MLDESALGDDKAEVSVNAVVSRVAVRIASFAEKNEVTVTTSGEPARIVGNETLVEEMVYNLVENGIRYNHPGGSVAVSVTHEDAPAEGSAARRTGEAERQVVIRVSDTGSGIPEELHDKIFERFFRLEKSRSKETGGTGLGLAIVKHAVMYHGGTIKVESAEGEGTTFVLRLPDGERA